MFSYPFPKWASRSNITAEVQHCSGGGLLHWMRISEIKGICQGTSFSLVRKSIDNWIITNLVMTSQEFLQQMTWCWQWTYHLKIKLENAEADEECKKLEKNWKFLELTSTEEVVKKLNKKRNLKKWCQKKVDVDISCKNFTVTLESVVCWKRIDGLKNKNFLIEQE